MRRKILWLIGALLLLIPAIAGAQYMARVLRIQTFEQCAEKFPVMESFPRQCRAGWKTFVESIPEEEETEQGNIRVASPQPGDIATPTQRHVPHAEGLPQLAIEELLAGPTELEEIAGFRTNIHPGVELIDVQIEGGVARANFSGEMQRELGGSCRVLAIRSQIRETLKQFPEIREVVIAVEGETEEVLQP